MPKLILIVDDNPDEAEIFVSFLRRKGISNPVRTMPDGLAAIDYLYGLDPYSNRRLYPFPALVFLDINMPRATGFDVLEWFQSHPEIPAPRLVIWSNVVSFSEIKKCKELGANSFLFKAAFEDQFRDLLVRYTDVWEFADPSPSTA